MDVRHLVHRAADQAVGVVRKTLFPDKFTLAIGDAAQGFVVDAQLREGGGNFLVTPVEIGFAACQILGLLAHGAGVVELLGDKQRSAKDGNGAECEQPVADLRNVVIVAVVFSGELLARGRGGQQVQEQQFAAAVAGQAPEVELAGCLVAVDDLETEVRHVAARLADRRNRLRMGQNIDGQVLVAPDKALGEQILVELVRLRGEA